MELENGHGAGAIDETGQELAVLLDRARFLLEIMRSEAARPAVTAPVADPTSGAGQAHIAALEAEVGVLEARVISAEQQNERLMRLYVASFQLHATLDPAEVLASISEIVVNLVGADRFVLLLSDPSGGPASILLRQGFDEELSERALMTFAGRHYAGGDEQVDATLADGRLRWGEGQGKAASPVLATIPLNVNGRTVGAIALLRLLGHRRELGADEREMFDLLAAHAASALFAAQSYARAERKLRKLAGILTPARKIA
jgi:nitrate/nitrite-specific signal transduction histidine kinase